MRAKKLIRRLRNRWQNMRVPDRPALEQPFNAVCLLRVADYLAEAVEAVR